MFNYCIWYQLNKYHIINQIIIELADEFKTDLFEGHLTLEMGLNKKTGYKLFDFIKKTNNKNPTFYLNGALYQTQQDNFYALQQDYIINEDIIYPYNFISKRKQRLFHVSLMYKLNEPFTPQEFKLAQDKINKNNKELLKIHDKNVDLSLFFCNNKYPSLWKKIK